MNTALFNTLQLSIRKSGVEYFELWTANQLKNTNSVY